MTSSGGPSLVRLMIATPLYVFCPCVVNYPVRVSKRIMREVVVLHLEFLKQDDIRVMPLEQCQTPFKTRANRIHVSR